MAREGVDLGRVAVDEDGRLAGRQRADAGQRDGGRGRVGAVVDAPAGQVDGVLAGVGQLEPVGGVGRVAAAPGRDLGDDQRRALRRALGRAGRADLAARLEGAVDADRRRRREHGQRRRVGAEAGGVVEAEAVLRGAEGDAGHQLARGVVDVDLVAAAAEADAGAVVAADLEAARRRRAEPRGRERRDLRGALDEDR